MSNNTSRLNVVETSVENSEDGRSLATVDDSMPKLGINRPKTKLYPSQLTLSNDTTDGECDDLNSKNQDNVNSNTQIQMLSHDVSEEKIYSNNIKLNDILPAVQSMFDNLKLDPTKQFNRVDEHVKDFDKKFDEK
ncbi:unnamed protein product [Rotaria socialis]|uniref:Uncharacterized protein n=1 Tax=Rotaria socialis TaxID=392032 RepID=A0A818XA64_9BILA|nr:unnamed protein product [Rotaria socialis]